MPTLESVLAAGDDERLALVVPDGPSFTYRQLREEVRDLAIGHPEQPAPKAAPLPIIFEAGDLPEDDGQHALEDLLSVRRLEASPPAMAQDDGGVDARELPPPLVRIEYGV